MRFLICRLQELILDQNLLSVLPVTIWELKFLKILRVANNRLALPPDKFAEMRALVLSVSNKSSRYSVLILYHVCNVNMSLLFHNDWFKLKGSRKI